MYKEPFDPDAPFDIDTASELEVLEWMNSVTAWAEENEKEGFQINARSLIGRWAFSDNLIRLEPDRF